MNKTTLAVGTLAMIALAGCTQTLVHDEVRRSVPPASYCAGGEWTNDSSIAAVPIPGVAFLSPQVDLNEIKADDYLKRCGDTTTLVNRTVDVDRTACVPASLSRILTLGIYQWCPSYVSWRAGVTRPRPDIEPFPPAS